MKKTAFTILTILFCSLTAISQTLYLSNSQFEFGVEPTATNNTITLSDDNYIYGLIVFEGKNIDDLSRAREYNGFKAGIFDYEITIKGTSIYAKQMKSTLIEKDKKLYLYIGILPNPEENYDGVAKTWRDYWKEMKIGENSIKLFSNEGVKFKLEFKLTKNGKYNDEQLQDLFWNAEESATKYFNSIDEAELDKLDAEKGLSEKYQRSFDELYLPYNLTDPELSQQNVETYLSNHRGYKVEVIKLGVYKHGTEWTIVKNNKGEILRKSSPHIVAVYKSIKDNWCYGYAFNVAKEYDGSNYGNPYIIKNTEGIGTHRCNCEKIVFKD